jgi:hypothetical protein
MLSGGFQGSKSGSRIYILVKKGKESIPKGYPTGICKGGKIVERKDDTTVKKITTAR